MATNGDALKFTLYTNHRCPFAHRVHIVLKELGLKYEEVFIDLDKPREPWYLEINPVRADITCSLSSNHLIMNSSLSTTKSCYVSSFVVPLCKYQHALPPDKRFHYRVLPSDS
jgi:glutathionyl-hydroquinone reductase